MTAIAGIAMITGSIFVLLAGVGAIRFGDVYARMHAATKGPTLGLMLTALGVGLTFDTAAIWLSVTLVVVLQMLTGPVGAHLVGHAIHHTEPPDVDDVDELTRDTNTSTGRDEPNPH